MSNGKLIHRIYIGVYCDPEITAPVSDIWVFESGEAVLTEGNENFIQE